MKLKEITIKVTYEIGLGNVKIPKKAYKQLLEAYENGDEIEMQSDKYPEAEEWILQNFKESDCMDWKSEITDLCEK